MAVKLARLNGRLRVLIWTDDDEIVVQYRQEIFARLHDSDIEISFGRIYPDAQHRLRTYLEKQCMWSFVIVAGLLRNYLSDPGYYLGRT